MQSIVPNIDGSLSRLDLFRWRQFADVTIPIHPRLTVLVGPNGSGKTTILKIIAQHFGWLNEDIATPVIDKRSGSTTYSIEYKAPQDLQPKVNQSPVSIASIPEGTSGMARLVGKVHYVGAEKAHNIWAGSQPDSPSYQIEIEDVLFRPGVYFQSHRRPFSYHYVSSLQLQDVPLVDIFYQAESSLRQSTIAHSGHVFVPNVTMKDQLIRWAVLGPGNDRIPPNSSLTGYLDNFQAVLRVILPDSLGFERLEVRVPEVVLITKSGEFSLDAVSGGLGVLLEYVWLLFLYDPSRSTPLIALIDEVESHLHPAMQRTVLPALLEIFPYVQFIVTTHSPLIVGSAKESTVVALRHDANHRIVTQVMDLDTRTGTATSVLRDILDVPTTIPLWAAEVLEEATQRYVELPPSSDTLAELRNELALNGLEEFAPDVIANVLGGWEDRK